MDVENLNMGGHAAFLLNNGKSYPTANFVGALEYFMWSYLWPRNDWWWMQKGWLYIGQSGEQK